MQVDRKKRRRKKKEIEDRIAFCATDSISILPCSLLFPVSWHPRHHKRRLQVSCWLWNFGTMILEFVNYSLVLHFFPFFSLSFSPTPTSLLEFFFVQTLSMSGPLVVSIRCTDINVTLPPTFPLCFPFASSLLFGLGTETNGLLLSTGQYIFIVGKKKTTTR